MDFGENVFEKESDCVDSFIWRCLDRFTIKNFNNMVLLSKMVKCTNICVVYVCGVLKHSGWYKLAPNHSPRHSCDFCIISGCSIVVEHQSNGVFSQMSYRIDEGVILGLIQAEL